jgi:arylsulfatase A-like enzyme
VPDGVPRRPNVVLISIDALRADHVGAYGYSRPTTPRIDELAREGVMFRRAWAHSPSTRYSVPAILTGRYESTIAWGNPSVHWPPIVLPENRLLAEMFKDLGYHTGALVPAHYFEPGWGLTQGFDDYDNSLARLHQNPFNNDPARATGSSSKELGDLAVGWIADAAKQQKPFFLWMHFYDPHYLYERHPDCAACSFGEADADLYDGEVRFTDLHVGRVLDALRASGAWDKTVVIVTADHGEGFGEHGVKTHGYHIYVQQNLVPLVVRVPGIAPRVVEEPVGHIDLFPTLLNLLRAPDEPQLLGRSMLDLMLGGSSPRLVFQEVEYEGPTVRKAVASRDWQLIGNIVPDGTYELYHLAVDPAEEHDLYVRGAGGEQARLESALGEWIDQSALPDDFLGRVAGNVSDAPLPSAEHLGAELIGDGRTLLVVEGVDAKTRRARAGDAVEVDLVLRLPARLPPGWRLYTHALNSTGGFLNLDHDPVENFVPFPRLRPGQWVRDRIRFTVPPSWRPGTITVEAGLFRGRERARVRIAGQPDGDSVRAAAIVLAP